VANLQFEVNHNLEPAEVRRRVDGLLNQFKDQLSGNISDLHQEWDGMRNRFSFQVAGAAVTGTMDAQPKAFVINVDVPWHFTLFQGQIESLFKQHATKLLGEENPQGRGENA
jgi:hypothetical protein